MKIVVIDYGAGNLFSMVNALEIASNGHEIIVSNKKEDLKKANYIILPGVAAFGDCMNGLKACEGLLEELRAQIMNEKKPFLGICVGMQVLASIGFEDGENKGLGFIDGKVVKIESEGLKVPQMGWNNLEIRQNHPILKEVQENSHVYFANSYQFIAQNQGNIVAQVEYGGKINAILAKNNIVGIQFHPEKSGEVGLKILSNFLSWRY
jgi:glutamine amidotransferase